MHKQFPDSFLNFLLFHILILCLGSHVALSANPPEGTHVVAQELNGRNITIQQYSFHNQAGASGTNVVRNPIISSSHSSTLTQVVSEVRPGIMEVVLGIGTTDILVLFKQDYRGGIPVPHKYILGPAKAVCRSSAQSAVYSILNNDLYEMDLTFPKKIGFANAIAKDWLPPVQFGVIERIEKIGTSNLLAVTPSHAVILDLVTENREVLELDRILAAPLKIARIIGIAGTNDSIYIHFMASSPAVGSYIARIEMAHGSVSLPQLAYIKPVSSTAQLLRADTLTQKVFMAEGHDYVSLDVHGNPTIEGANSFNLTPGGAANLDLRIVSPVDLFHAPYSPRTKPPIGPVVSGTQNSAIFSHSNAAQIPSSIASVNSGIVDRPPTRIELLSFLEKILREAESKLKILGLDEEIDGSHRLRTSSFVRLINSAIADPLKPEVGHSVYEIFRHTNPRTMTERKFNTSHDVNSPALVLTDSLATAQATLIDFHELAGLIAKEIPDNMGSTERDCFQAITGPIPLILD